MWYQARTLGGLCARRSLIIRNGAHCIQLVATSASFKDLQAEKVARVIDALKQCSSSRDLERGKRLHADAAESGCDGNIYVATTLVHMYAKCGSLFDAREVFDGMVLRNVATWNALILAYVENGESEVALELFSQLEQTGGHCAPNARTFVAALTACASLAEKEEGKHLDGVLVKLKLLQKGMSIHSKQQSLNDIFVANALVNLYAKCGSVLDARTVFDRMPFHDVVTWNAMIMGYVENGERLLALELFSCMRTQGCDPDSRTFVAAFMACASLDERAEEVDGKMVRLKCLERGMEIHSQTARSGCDSETFVGNTLIDMYAKCGSLVDARRAFDRMHHHNVVSWNILILGYVDHGEAELALKLFFRMQSEGSCPPNSRTFFAASRACIDLAVKEESKPVCGRPTKLKSLKNGMAIHSQAVAQKCCGTDIFLDNSLVEMYSKCGSMADARRVFDGMSQRNLVTWNSLILGYAENGEGELALEMFARMDCTPDAQAFVAALIACGNIVAVTAGKGIQAHIYRLGLESNLIVANCLLDFYAKSGSTANSQHMFDSSSAAGADIVLWNALLAGYSQQGETERVFDLFGKMQQEGMKPDGITFLSILTACSHAGLVQTGRHYFQKMSSSTTSANPPTLQHYTCMIDMLGRANHLEEAVELVNSMPFEADPVTWMTLLASCRKWNNLKVGKLAFDSLLKLDCKHPAAYLLMANIYGSLEMWKEHDEMLKAS